VISSINRLRRIGRLADVPLVLHIMAVAALVPILARLPLPKLAALLEPGPGIRAASTTEQQLVRYVDGVLRTGGPLLHRSCLTRGVTLFYFLRRMDVAVDLCFGASPRGGKFEAHCWLEKDGEPVLEVVDPRITLATMYRITARNSAN
jgi:hypothetical protein